MIALRPSYRVSLTCRFHARRRVDRVAEEAESRHGEAHNTCAAHSRVDADSEMDRGVGKVSDAELAGLMQQI